MNVFAIIATKSESVAPIKAAVESKFVEAFIQAGETIWFVSGEGTAIETSQKLGVAGKLGGNVIDVIILAVTSYWGHTERTTWEWIKNRLEAK